MESTRLNLCIFNSIGALVETSITPEHYEDLFDAMMLTKEATTFVGTSADDLQFRIRTDDVVAIWADDGLDSDDIDVSVMLTYRAGGQLELAASRAQYAQLMAALDRVTVQRWHTGISANGRHYGLRLDLLTGLTARPRERKAPRR